MESNYEKSLYIREIQISSNMKDTFLGPIHAGKIVRMSLKYAKSIRTQDFRIKKFVLHQIVHILVNLRCYALLEGFSPLSKNVL